MRENSTNFAQTFVTDGYNKVNNLGQFPLDNLYMYTENKIIESFVRTFVIA